MDFVPIIWEPIIAGWRPSWKMAAMVWNFNVNYSFEMFHMVSTINIGCYFPQQYQQSGDEWGFCRSHIGRLCSLAAIFKNGRHGRHGTNPKCLQYSKWLLWCLVGMCQVSCFYHKVHIFSVICWTASAAYMRQWIGSTLLQIMACLLFGAKPLSKPMAGYC